MKIFAVYFIGAVLRYSLINSEYAQLIAERPEISTPLNSWKRITETLHLLDLNIHPSTSDILHESPLHLLVYQCLVKTCGKYLYVIFIICDILTAYLLSIFAKKYMQYVQKIEAGKKNLDVHTLNDEDINTVPQYLVTAYMLNPYIIFNCVGFTTTVFGNFLLALFLVGLVYGNVLTTSMSLALCISQQFHPIVLLSPVLLQHLVVQKNYTKAISAVILTSIIWIIITCFCYYTYASWDFINDTYGFILTVPNLRPNIGLFWYLLTEVFEYFRYLFVYSLQINVTILYILPISICFRKDPCFVAATLLSLIAIYKSYACLGDVGFILTLYVCWKHLFQHLQQGLFGFTALIVATILSPVVWYLWIYAGVANVNFYFSITLVIATCQIVLLVNVLFSYKKREFLFSVGSFDKSNSQIALE